MSLQDKLRKMVICDKGCAYISPLRVCSEPWPGLLPQCKWNWLRMYELLRGPPDILAPYDSSTLNWTETKLIDARALFRVK